MRRRFLQKPILEPAFRGAIKNKKSHSQIENGFFKVVRVAIYSILIQPSFIEIFAPFLTFTQPQAVLISTSEALV